MPSTTYHLSGRFRWLLWPLVVTALLAVVLLLPPPAGASPGGEPPPMHVFVANLSGADEVPAVNTMASGRAVLVLGSDMSTLAYRVMVNDITNITASHIHLAPDGENGPVVFPLYTGEGEFGPGAPISGVLTLSGEQVSDLLTGNYYVNVHTTENPGGEIRGQVEEFMPAQSYNALLTGSSEVPPVDTAALGVAKFRLPTLDTLEYTVAVTDITDITASHIHLAPEGVNGPVIFPLYTGEGEFDPDNPINGTVNLSSVNLVDLLTGFYYVNVHTSANPPGEIRGQIGGARLFQADLSGAQEVPPVETAASGRAVLALDGDGETLYYRVMVSDIVDVTASHIHEAPVGVNGPVIFPLFTGEGEFDPDNPVSGMVTLSEAQLFTMMGGGYYINVHTAANPPGEIRGQIASYTPPGHFVTTLTGANEVPPVETSATGTAHLTLDMTTDMLHYTVVVADIMNVTASHIHKAPVGVNGPVIFPLFTGDGTFDADNPVGGAVMLNAENLVDLLSGFYYINVHTTANPPGEIRGQIFAGAAPTSITLSNLQSGRAFEAWPLVLAWVALAALAGSALARGRHSNARE